MTLSGLNQSKVVIELIQECTRLCLWRGWHSKQTPRIFLSRFFFCGRIYAQGIGARSSFFPRNFVVCKCAGQDQSCWHVRVVFFAPSALFTALKKDPRNGRSRGVQIYSLSTWNVDLLFAVLPLTRGGCFFKNWRAKRVGRKNLATFRYFRCSNLALNLFFLIARICAWSPSHALQPTVAVCLWIQEPRRNFAEMKQNE